MAQAILKQQASGFRIAPPTHSVKPWYGNWRSMHSAAMTSTPANPGNPYAQDGLCHNAEAGSYNHECAKPATWLGIVEPGGWASGFCDRCKEHGHERHGFTRWERLAPASSPVASITPKPGPIAGGPRP